MGSHNNATIHLNGEHGNIRLGGDGEDGDIAIFSSSATSADVGSFSNATIHLNGDSGDIILRNADAAEEFDVTENADVAPGTVMVIGDDGSLEATLQSYDRRVAGVVSGAGDTRPGIILGREAASGARAAVALAGKVYCNVDADYGPINVGDMLTTSPTRGHGMKATDPVKAFGSVIGKALRPLRSGQGIVPVLVALQ